jgi:hypothetical protein
MSHETTTNGAARTRVVDEPAVSVAERLPAGPLPASVAGEEGDAPGSLVIERLLRDRERIWRQIKFEHEINSLIWSMLVTSGVALAAYGAIMGISSGPLYALSSAVKLPLLFLLTLAICLPTLYLFNLFYGGRLSARQVLALALAAITVTAGLTLAFAPVAVFFLITARDYTFYKLLNVAILGLTGVAGLSFLVSGMRGMNALDLPPQPRLESAAQPQPEGSARPQPGAAPRPVSMPLLQIWLLLFGFVGTQLGWTLRPFFGAPGLPFELFRSLEGNFYLHLIQLLVQMVFPSSRFR